MILAQNESPKNSLYYIGALLVRTMSEERFAVIDTLSLYERLKTEKLEGISLSRYLYALDWLFIIGLIELSPTGDIKKCF